MNGLLCLSRLSPVWRWSAAAERSAPTRPPPRKQPQRTCPRPTRDAIIARSIVDRLTRGNVRCQRLDGSAGCGLQRSGSGVAVVDRSQHQPGVGAVRARLVGQSSAAHAEWKNVRPRLRFSCRCDRSRSRCRRTRRDFSALCGIDDTTDARTAQHGVKFSVEADGKEVFQSAEQQADRPPAMIDLDVRGVHELTLKATATGRFEYTPCDWTDVKLTRGDGDGEVALLGERLDLAGDLGGCFNFSFDGKSGRTIVAGLDVPIGTVAGGKRSCRPALHLDRSGDGNANRRRDEKISEISGCRMDAAIQKHGVFSVADSRADQIDGHQVAGRRRHRAASQHGRLRGGRQLSAV